MAFLNRILHADSFLKIAFGLFDEKHIANVLYLYLHTVVVDF